MNKIQQKLFTLLCEVDDICRKNDITYYLAAGCALGAVRHGGFLPWDDDVDLYITRDNWEKLKTVIYDHLPENRNFVCEEFTEFYDNPIGRYVDRETTQMMLSQVICGECCGIVVEFFIMDPMPKGEMAEKEHCRYMRTFTELLSPYFLMARHMYSPDQYLDYDLYCEYEKRVKTEGRRAILEELKSKFACFPEDEAEHYCMRWGTKTWTFDAKHFGPPSSVSFEGREFPTLNYPREYFRSGFGDDWMYVPDQANQVIHDLSKNLDRPYQDYVELYMPVLDKDELYATFQRKKDKLMSFVMARADLYLAYHRLIGSIVSHNIQGNIPNLDYLRNCLDNGDFALVDQELKYYYENQLSNVMLADYIYIDLGDDFLSLALDNLILQGKYHKAEKILRLRQYHSDDSFSPSLERTKDHIQFCRELSKATMDDDASAETVQQLMQKHPEYESTAEYQCALLWSMRSKYSTIHDIRSILEHADRVLETFPDNGELMWYRAWALHMLGNKDAAPAYLDAVNNTRNGFVWKEAKDLYGIEPDEVRESREENDEESNGEK